MRRLILTLALLAAPCLVQAADAPSSPAFNAAARLADVQAKFQTNRERAAALDAEAKAMQWGAEATIEVQKLQGLLDLSNSTFSGWSAPTREVLISAVGPGAAGAPFLSVKMGGKTWEYKTREDMPKCSITVPCESIGVMAAKCYVVRYTQVECEELTAPKDEPKPNKEPAQ